MSGGCNAFGVAVTALGAGVGLLTGCGTGGSGGDLRSVAVAANRLRRTANGTAAAGIAVGHGLAAGVADTLLRVHQVLAGAGGLGVLQSQAAIGVLGQSKGNLDTAGNIQLFIAALNQLAGGIGAVRLCHVPLFITFGLHKHEAVGSKGSGQLAGRTKFVRTHVGGVFFAAVVGTVDEADQIIGLVVVGIRCTADGTAAAFIAVTGGCDGFGVAVTAEGAGEGLYTGFFTGGSGGDLGGITVSTTLSPHLILVELQVGNIACRVHIGRSISTELGGAELIVDASGSIGVVQNVTAGTAVDGPGVGSIRKLKISTGIISQITAVGTQGNAAGGLLDVPHRQVAALDNTAVYGDRHRCKLAAGNGRAQSLISAAVVRNDHKLAAGGDLGGIGNQNKAGIGDSIAGIVSTADATAAAGILVSGGCNAFGVAVAALGAGVGLLTGCGTGGSSGDLGSIAVAADSLCQAADGTPAVGIAVGTGNSAGITLTVGVIKVLAGTLGHRVLQLQGAVVISGQSEVDLDTGRHISLVGIGNAGVGVIEGEGLGSTLEAFGHVPVGIVAGLDTHIAFHIKGGSELTGGGELILAQIGGILLAAVVGTVDEAKQIVFLGNGTPGAAAGIPGILCHGVAVGSVGGDSQISGLVPLTAPIIGAAVGVHPTEDHTGASAGNGTFV